ncbi:unnamed protein product [Ranitomeya imitator]|uniref:Integrase n=1 Tax=Ranitomeya imitator TaxID=111125 RepID=A0ABN9M519_9NEOB|nr:unnamed protein product [Ranitomeya imitator]
MSAFDLGCPEDLIPLIRSSIAPSTWRDYGKVWEKWCHLAADKLVGSSDDSRMQVTMAFLSRMHAKGVSGAVARNAYPRWRRKDNHSDNRHPISFQQLVSLIKAALFICESDYETAFISAAFGLAFFGAMSVSEVLAPALNKAGGLRREDILICDNGLRIRIRRSKTDQEGRGTWFPIFAIKGIFAR